MRASFVKVLMIVAAPLALSACTSYSDMQGMDPKDYYAAHPVENKVEMRSLVHLVHFQPAQPKLADDEANLLRMTLRPVSPAAVESVRVGMSDADLHNDARKENLKKMLRTMGIAKSLVTFEPAADVARDDAMVNMDYAVAVPPKCPDWRRSPVTSYSNTMQGNFKCAEVTNLGLMVDDPRDLVRGSGEVHPDADRDAKVIQDYRAGKDFNTWKSAGSSGDSGGGGSSTVSSGVGATGGQ